MQDPLGPGIEPMYPALQGRLLTTRPPGKPQNNASNALLSNKKSVPALPTLNLSDTGAELINSHWNAKRRDFPGG